MVKDRPKCMESKMQKIYEMVGGGRLGDFLHQLYVPKMYYLKYGIKTNLFISNIAENYAGDNKFSNGLEKTFEQLKPIILKQDFISDFNIDYSNDLKNYLNLSSWRSSKLLFYHGWTEILIDTFFNKEFEPKNFNILNWENKNNFFDKSLVINRSINNRRTSNSNEISLKIIESFPEDKRFFICSEEEQYNEYPHKKLLNLILIKDLEDFFTIINSCELYMGNLTGITSIAYALKKNMLCEFGYTDHKSYSEETKYHNNISWYFENNIYANDYIKEKINV